jgi:2,4-dienoyl-CoA reductase-like NADH-dependent reductase (Old Yellow Enzyme family)
MGIMFEPSMINGLQITNHFVRSATWEGMAAEDGKVTPKLIELMTELAVIFKTGPEHL